MKMNMKGFTGLAIVGIAALSVAAASAVNSIFHLIK